MKTYLCVAAILSGFVLVQSNHLHELAPELKNQVDECLQEFGLTDEVFKTPDFEDSKLKCFTACVLKKGDRLTDGKLSVDKELDATAMYMPEKVDDSLKEKFTDCINIANEEKDDCAVGGSLYKCLYEKYGIWKVE